MDEEIVESTVVKVLNPETVWQSSLKSARSKSFPTSEGAGFLIMPLLSLVYCITWERWLRQHRRIVDRMV